MQPILKSLRLSFFVSTFLLASGFAAVDSDDALIEALSQNPSNLSLERLLDSIEPEDWEQRGADLLAAVSEDQNLHTQTRLMTLGILLQSFSGLEASNFASGLGALDRLASDYQKGSLRNDQRSRSVARKLEELASMVAGSSRETESSSRFDDFMKKLRDAEARMSKQRNQPKRPPRTFFGILFGFQEPYEYDFNYPQNGEIPPLLERWDEVAASDLLDRALAVRVEWSLDKHVETRELAVSRALEMIERMELPQWKWVVGDRADALFTALVQKFGIPGKNDEGIGIWSFNQAASLVLVQRGLSDDQEGTLEIASMLDWDEGVYLDVWRLRVSHAEKAALFSNLLSVQKQFPRADFWDVLRRLGAETGNGAALVEAAREVAKNADSPETRITARRILAEALLADDAVEEGIDLLLENLAAVRAANFSEEFGEALDDALTVLRVGALLKRPDLVDGALDFSLANLDAEIASGNQPTYRFQVLLRSLNWQDSLDPWMRVRAWHRAALEANLPGLNDADSRASRYRLERLFTMLQWFELDLASKFGEHEEVLRIATALPHWPAANVGEVIKGQTMSESPLFFTSYPLLLATSLEGTGAKEEASEIARALLPRNLGDDEIYDLFLRTTEPDPALVHLEALGKIDVFEERPLIWQAHLLLESGKLEEARRTIQKAIQIDPSDGEQGRGKRMRAYGILGKIAAAEGKDEEVAFLNGVIAAIRLSEDADRYWTAGLLAQALDLYRESLYFFEDAYCIQSRLALRFVEQGKIEEAKKHYRKAYELMPDSFGRIESHCFGCEGAFRGDEAQLIAEDVFLSMLEERSEHPQLHYLLGYLRESQSEPLAAADHYRRAVELDPLYYNAWYRLFGLRSEIELSDEEEQKIALQLIQLDPALVRTRSDDIWKLIDNVERLWKIGKTSIVWGDLYDRLPTAPEFPAAAESLSKRTRSSSWRSNPFRNDPITGPGDYLVRLPAGKVAREIYELLADAGANSEL
ncbi:MAG: hypothetical protein ACFCU4_06375 [Puniceicoccaceae bacterium]